MKSTLFVLALAAALAAMLGACANPTPPPQWYQLRAAPPLPSPPPAASTTAGGAVQLLLPVAVPELLSRDSLLVPQGQSGVQALAGHRWAEPLQDAVPRLLRQDLAVLLGQSRVWAAPVPAGVAITRQLRVEVLALQVSADGTGVALQARWTVSDPSGRTPPQVQVTQITAAAAAATPDAWVAAHRLALWRLAEEVAQTLR